MVNIRGWTPVSHESELETSSLGQFISPFGRIEKGDCDYPIVRSGHRCFTDNDYLYVVGGYTHKIREGAIFKEIWAMSLATFEWRRYEVIGELPETLASFALVQILPFSKMFVLFGGSGTSFGTSSSNNFYFVRVDNENCSIQSHLLNVEGNIPQPKYGHAMCAGEEPGKYYIIGGTSGTRFNFDVHALTMRTNSQAATEAEKFTWHCELITENKDFAGRYRLEVVHDADKDCLLFFGGGNNLEVYGFEQMITLNLQTYVTSEVSTTPDAIHGFPEPRRCHSLVRHGKHIIITGGIYHNSEPQSHRLHSDVWIFNIENYSWRKYEHSLPKPVFFHDATITEDGCMLLFGGVHGISASSRRNNKLYSVWFDIPRLQRFALESLRKEFPSKFVGLYCGNIKPSGVFEVFNVLCKSGRIKEKEREIVENGRIPFHEKENRTRYYLNGPAENFAITCPYCGGKMQLNLRHHTPVEKSPCRDLLPPQECGGASSAAFYRHNNTDFTVWKSDIKYKLQHQVNEEPVIRLARRPQNQQQRFPLNIPNDGPVNQQIREFLERIFGVRRDAQNEDVGDDSEEEEDDDDVEEDEFEEDEDDGGVERDGAADIMNMEIIEDEDGFEEILERRQNEDPPE